MRRIAAGIGLKVGDRLTVNVLGRNITARVANLRTVEWRSLGINFVMLFSPNTFAGAPHTNLATVTSAANGAGATDAALMRRLAVDFPSVTAVRVRDALEAVNTIVGQLATAIRGASGLAIAREPARAGRRARRRAARATLRRDDLEDARRDPSLHTFVVRT